MDFNEPREVSLVKPLQYTHIHNVIRTIFDANEFDPVICYRNDNPNFAMDSLPFFRRYNLIFQSGLLLFTSIYMRRALTIGAGDGFVMFTPAGSPRSSPLERIVSAVVGWLLNFLQSFDSAELKIRREECVDGIEAVVKTAFGDGVKDMVSLDSLSTAPASQGQGYGSQLVKAVTDVTEAQGRRTWLVSSNVANTGFYARCGFSIAGEFILGASNPTWKKEPIVVRILVRKPTRDKA